MILKRLLSNKDGLFGEITLPSGLKLATLELNWKENKSNVSCIPTAKYRCEIVQSPRFGRVYEVKNVPNRSHILIHAGNWISDIQGCILVGMSRNDQRLFDSKKALNILMSQMNKEPFELTILDMTDAK